MAVTSIQASTAYTLSFDSTLYTSPILDLLLANVPTEWHFDLRLGLQEALVNAVKHGNKLDLSRKVTIDFFMASETYHWIVKDQGVEGKPTIENQAPPCSESECGRGIFIMEQVFDYVHWNHYNRQLHLLKQIYSLDSTLSDSSVRTSQLLATC